MCGWSLISPSALFRYVVFDCIDQTNFLLDRRRHRFDHFNNSLSMNICHFFCQLFLGLLPFWIMDDNAKCHAPLS